MELEILLNRLEALVADSPHLPLTGKVLVDAQEILSLVRDLRLTLPDDVREARRLLDERQLIMEEAREEAAAALSRAENQADRLVDESTVLLEAQEKAENLVAESERVAREIRLRAREYADETLERLQGQLERMLETLTHNREDLRR